MNDPDFDELTRRLSAIRGTWTESTLDRVELDPDPFVQLANWMEHALQILPELANAMSLASADAEGAPSLRTVLLKGLDREGLLFFTNYESRKGRELIANPRAAALLYWPPLNRQVSVAGRVVKLSRAESFDYFSSRSYESRLGAWASEQSAVIAGREALDARVAEVEARFAGGDVPLPDSWGGFRLIPVRFEFWQGRKSRLHDRFRYQLDEAERKWRIDRLAP